MSDEIKKITPPLTDEMVKGLNAGDQVSITGRSPCSTRGRNCRLI